MNPIATLHIANGKNIVIEFLPGSAPNTVNSFAYTASRGYLDRHATERIMPGDRVDTSCTALGKKECRHLIPNESKLNLGVVPLDSHPGAVYMSGYGEAGLAGCEFFFSLRDCPDHRGIYPVFGRILEGVDELYRLERVRTVPVTDFPIGGVEVNRPMKPGVTERMEPELHSKIYPEPVRVREPELPECWK